MNIIFILLFFLNCANQNQEAIKPIEKKDFNSITNIIYDETFGLSNFVQTFKINFYKNNQYKIYYGSEGWYWENNGTFFIQEEKIILTTKSCTFWNEKDIDCKNSFKTGICYTKPDENSIEFKYNLVCEVNKKFKVYTEYQEPENSFIVAIRKFKTLAGLNRVFRNYKNYVNGKENFENIEVVTMGNIEGITNDSVVIRQGPGTDYTKLSYYPEDANIDFLNEKKSLPKKTKLTIHARTPNKQKVKNWENYWLLVSLKFNQYVWVFGEFVDYEISTK